MFVLPEAALLVESDNWLWLQLPDA